MNQYEIYLKVRRVVNSCENTAQLKSAENYWKLFKRKFRADYQQEKGMWFLFKRKQNELKNPKTPQRSKTLPRTRPAETEPPIRTR